MKRMQRVTPALMAACLLMVAVPCLAPSDRGIRPAVRQSEAYGQLPLYFARNQGQLDPCVAYSIQGRDKTLYFTSDGITFALTEPWEGPGCAIDLPAPSDRAPQRWIVKLAFLGATPDARPVGLDETPAVISYFRGRPEEWRTGIRTYARIIYPDLWPGIDLELSGTVSQLKYQFLVRPGADPGLIRLAYSGATAVAVNRDGQLEISTPFGGFHDDVPYAYQDIDGERVDVDARYAVGPAGVGEQPYGFDLAAYDPTLPLVIDPAVLVYCGYIGGTGCDGGRAVAVDASGNAYVTGNAYSSHVGFPTAVGPDETHSGGSDAFVAKVNVAGTGLVYCGYIGGDENDAGKGIAVDSSGSAFVTGVTRSSEASFPVTVGPDLTRNGTREDAFVAKVSPSGTQLAYCGYIGGYEDDIGYGIAVDAAGNAYVAGLTYSPEGSFPEIVGPDLTFNGYNDAFVAKVSPGGTGLVYCGYIGGAHFDYGMAIAVDRMGNAYVTGQTRSDETSFPVTGELDPSHNGRNDVFVAKVDVDGTGLAYCGYIGGDADDRGYGIAVDATGRAYVGGYTDSSESTFPATGGPNLVHSGGNDLFVTRVDASGAALEYCGYVGTGGDDRGWAIAVDGSGNAYIAGKRGYDAFIAQVNPSGTDLGFEYVIGGSVAGSLAYGIAVDRWKNIYVVGETRSDQSSFPVISGPDLTHNGDVDAFVAKISVQADGPPPGDVNGDGDVDVIDVRLCCQIALGVIPGAPEQRLAADIDRDEDVDMDDVRALAEYIIGIRTTLP